MNKKNMIFGVVVIVVVGAFFVLHHLKSMRVNKFEPVLNVQEEHTRLMIEQKSYEDGGREFVRVGRLTEAIAEYKKALDPKFLINSWSKSLAVSSIAKILQLKGDFDGAAHVMNDYPAEDFPDSAVYNWTQPEILALIESKKENSYEPIHEYIHWLFAKYGYLLPPNKVRGGIGTHVIRMYDYVEDYEKGIEFINKVLDDQSLKEKPRQEYLKIRQAFQESKAGMPKICVDGGKTCIGRATYAIIQSDYFPW